LNWNRDTDSLRGGKLGAMTALIETMTDQENDTIEEIHPMVLAAKANADDNPTWEQAMNGPNKERYWQACVKEIETLTTSKEAWEVVTRERWMNILPSTGAFKCRQYPDGLVRKLKARFCAGGHRLVEGRDYFETFTPVAISLARLSKGIASLIAIERAWYSASIVDVAISDCCLLLQTTEQLAMKILTKHVRLFTHEGSCLSSYPHSPAKSASI
jgi:hypothetical protein